MTARILPLVAPMLPPLDKPLRTRRWFAPMATTLAGWLAAFLVVSALFTFLGDVLESLPLALRALVVSGALVTLMVNVVMPVISASVARWIARDVPSGVARSSYR
jgi:antibiotic biosynthesis monooxygenase (ABM) superfamily enzyme